MFLLQFRSLIVTKAALGLLLTACGGQATTTTEATTTDEGGVAFREPGDPADADRTVEIVASDTFRFDPDTLSVSAGETVTFRIINPGQVIHDFVLGDQATQDEHEAQMAEMGDMMMPDEANAIGVAAGETKELTWRFTQPGTVLIGCHEPGHYPAMKGEITVES